MTMPTKDEALQAIALEKFMKERAEYGLNQYSRGLITLAELIQFLHSIYEESFTCDTCHAPGTTLKTKLTNPADPTVAYMLSCGHWNI